MEQWRKDARQEPVITDLDALVPKNHLLRKIEKVMDYEWLYEHLSPYYCHTNGRPETDLVVLIKMVLSQHLFGIPSLRQTYERINDTLSYRWFLGYGLLDDPPFCHSELCFLQAISTGTDRRDMRSARRPLNESLRTQKKSTA